MSAHLPDWLLGFSSTPISRSPCLVLTCPNLPSPQPCSDCGSVHATPGYLCILELIHTAQGLDLCLPLCSQMLQGSQDMARRVVCQQCLVRRGVKSGQDGGGLRAGTPWRRGRDQELGPGTLRFNHGAEGVAFLRAPSPPLS